MSIQIVSDFNKKSGDKWIIAGQKPIKKTLKSCLLDLQNFINDTVGDYLGSTTYDHKTVSDWIYKDTIDSTNNTEVENFVKVNLFAARQTFNNIVVEINSQKGGLTFRNIKRYRNLIYDFIHDVSSFIDYYK